MGRKHANHDDRFLKQRKGNWHYKRKVPAHIAAVDPRAPWVRMSLKTRDLALARLKRNELEDADTAYWNMLALGKDGSEARQLYLQAVKRAEARGFTYRTADAFASSETIEEIVRRFETIFDTKTPKPLAKAMVGHEEPPAVTVSEAFEVYCEEIAQNELKTKSPNQQRHWKKVKRRAVNNFIRMCGDKPINQITRDDALKVRKMWMDRITPKDGSEPTHTANSGNRDLGNMRKLIREYFTYMGDLDRYNPFDKLSCGTDPEKSRPPFPEDWIKEKFLQPGRLANLNDEARGIFLGLIETGARPSELCNIDPNEIVLDDPVPHLVIKHRTEHGNQREVKTDNSEREIPLVGVSLEVFRKFPNGFPRYKDSEDGLSATINKFLKENDLLPPLPKKAELPYSLYSLRHAFEDRMKVAGIGDEVRKIIFGHSREREAYGEGGSLYWRQQLLNKMVLPFDPSIV